MHLIDLQSNPDRHWASAVAQVLGAFVYEVSSFLLPEDLEESVRNNQARGPSGMRYDVCHLHDHCDANQAMINALDTVFGEDGWEHGDDVIDFLISTAWRKSDHVFDLIFPRLS